MQELRIAKVNGREIPVLVSDEKEALLAAKAAGGALIGLWRPGQEMDALSAANYVVEDLADVTDEFLERVARRHLGLPWHICETERLLIREMFADDFDEVWFHQIGRGFNSVEELQAYTKNQYAFYEFGFWALVLKETGELVGVAGLTVPEEISENERGRVEMYELRSACSAAEGTEFGPACGAVENAKPGAAQNATDFTNGETLELGYHIFYRCRQHGFAKEACKAILRYGAEELGAERFVVRIDHKNEESKRLAAALGFTWPEI